MGKEITWLIIIGICIKSSLGIMSLISPSVPPGNSTDWILDYTDIETKFSVRSVEEPEEDLCYLVPGKKDTVTQCGFNISLPTFAIIHGWSVAGLFESWIHKLIAALFERVPNANVIVVDWLDRAQHHYHNSAANTKLVGEDVARLINWLEYNLMNLHLLGYSLGAHVAGVAGNLTNNKVNRITGGGHSLCIGVLKVKHNVRHTSLITIPLLCHTLHLFIYFIEPDLDQIMKCAHERSVHLFIDSLVNKQQQSMAYRCNSEDAFDRGLCLSCRKNRCNNMGFGVNKIRTTKSAKMYLKTGASMPFKVFHYQMKFHVFNQQNLSLSEQPVIVSLYGTHGEKEDIQCVIPVSNVTTNTTVSFLLTTDVDLGELLRVMLQWDSDSYFSFFNSHKFMVRRIRVKAGETQSKSYSRVDFENDTNINFHKVCCFSVFRYFCQMLLWNTEV
uniref:Lipoprotein lipase n=1 Tax=Hucho hucho TaxID=62062 RepID=A0A4W5QIL9_9TELE